MWACVCIVVQHCVYLVCVRVLLLSRAHSGGVQSVTKRLGAPHKLYNALVHRVQPAGELSTMHTYWAVYTMHTFHTCIVKHCTKLLESSCISEHNDTHAQHIL